MEVFIGGNKTRLTPSMSIGKGGEADIYRVGDLAVKIFKAPNHPDFNGNSLDMENARLRIEEHQKKLREFPTNLPGQVVRPIDLVMDRTEKTVLGYTMRMLDNAEVLLRYSERSFRQPLVNNGVVAAIFQDVYNAVRGIHAAQVVLGDFNDLNVMVADSKIHIIDADSFQFGQFFCKVYTERFVDPLNCNPHEKRPILVRPHGPQSDWYAFNVMLFRSLLLCDPYGGVYRPQGKAPTITHTERPLHRITVFNKDVKYPKPSIPFSLLSDEILQHFHRVFEKDERIEFPVELLHNFRWTKCLDCGTEHGRETCPVCKRAAPAAIKAVTIVKGTVSSTRIFATQGEIVFAASQHDKLLWIYKEGQDFYRETGIKILDGGDRFRFRIQGSTTFAGRGNQVSSVGETLRVDTFKGIPLFDVNERAKYWIYGGTLYRDGQLGQERIGDVLASQTLFWVGPKFGFGFYRAGELNIAFVFNADKRGINDTVSIPPMRGHLIDATCYFTDKLCWFLTSLRYNGKDVNRCTVIDSGGKTVATQEADAGDGSWLSTIRGKCAVGGFLLSVTDEGIVRVEPDKATIAKTAEFPDTEQFVDSGCHLFPAKGGLYVVDRQEIRLLKIS